MMRVNFLIEQVQRNAPVHCAAIFGYSYSSSHNIQLLQWKNDSTLFCTYALEAKD